MKQSLPARTGRLFGALAFAALLVTSPSRAVDVTQDFSVDPFTNGWSFGVGDNSNSQFNWSSVNESMVVTVNSSLPSARLDYGLGTTIDGSQSFVFSTQFSLSNVTSPESAYMQFAFGLTNSTSTGGNRTGSLSPPSSANTYNDIEFDFYPQVDPTYGGPWLTPTIFGADAGGSVFANYAFESTSVLLPMDGTVLDAVFTYNADTQLLNLTVLDGLSTLATVSIDLATASDYNPAQGFNIDQLSIMAYYDGYGSALDPSLLGTMEIYSMSFQTVPEPASGALLAAGTLGLVLSRRRRR